MQEQIRTKEQDIVVIGDTHPMYDEVVDRYGAQAAMHCVEMTPIMLPEAVPPQPAETPMVQSNE